MTINEGAEGKPKAEISVEDFSALIASMSRLLTGLGRIRPFSEAELGLAEWVALTTLAQRDGVSNKVLGRKLGVTGQRVNQISASLARGGFIDVKQSAQDNRANEIRITDAGKAKVRAVNSQLKPMLSEALQGRERSLSSASKNMKYLTRLLNLGKSDKPDEAGGAPKKSKAG